MTYSDLKYINEFEGIQAERSDGVTVYFAPGTPEHKQSVAGDFGSIAAYEAPPQMTLEQIAEAQIRSQRNNLLDESDWTQVEDAPVDKVAWATYRQALRDVPQQTDFPTEVVWPEKPQ
jgi:hypothetical protein